MDSLSKWLRLGDILQYLTIADVDKITANAPLVYKTFLMQDKQSNGRTKTRKIQFDGDMSDEDMSGEDQLSASYDLLKQGDQTNMEIWKVNPRLMRNLKYMLTVSPDALSPRSEDLEKQFDLETYDRAIMNPMADQEEVYRLLLSTNNTTRKNPDKYIVKQQDPMQSSPLAGLTQNQMSPIMGANQKQAPSQALPPPPAAQPAGQYPQTASVGQLR